MKVDKGRLTDLPLDYLMEVLERYVADIKREVIEANPNPSPNHGVIVLINLDLAEFCKGIKKDLLTIDEQGTEYLIKNKILGIDFVNEP